MLREMTVIRLRILYCIYEMEGQNLTAAKIAGSLGIAKSTVTRAVEYFQAQGVLESCKAGFTVRDRKRIERYQEYKSKISNILAVESEMTYQLAEEEAIRMLTALREDTIRALLKQNNVEKQECMFCDIDGFCEKCIDYLLEDGEYDISFTMYKDSSKKYMSVSMANDGFYHPGKLFVKNGVGTVKIRGKKMIRMMPVGQGMIAGQVEKMFYLMNHRYETAVTDGAYWMFPAACMKFTYNKGEGALMGSASLKMSSSVGKMYMPESSALFTMVLIIR